MEIDNGSTSSRTNTPNHTLRQLQRFVKHVQPELRCLVSFVVCVVAEHFATTLNGGKFQVQVVAEYTLVASFSVLSKSGNILQNIV